MGSPLGKNAGDKTDQIVRLVVELDRFPAEKPGSMIIQ
jgi:hypothetical protein